MEIIINAVKFKPASTLSEFIDKKVKKIETLLPQARKAEVTLRVDKDQSEMNKIAEIKVAVSAEELFASKQCDSFEEAIDHCVDALKKQVEKLKDKWSK